MAESSGKQEIERKFRLDLTTLPFALDAQSCSHIEQGYLAISDYPTQEVRMRRRDGNLTLTVKTGTGVARGEGEVSLSQEQFRALWPFTESQRIEKTRHEIDLGTLTAELDVYAGRHKGLAVVEVEFRNRDTARNFEPPDWFGEEITENPQYSNQQLALTGRCPESL